MRALAAVSPRAALQAVPVWPVAAASKYQWAAFGVWLLFALSAGMVVLIASLALAFFDLLVLGGNGELYVVLWVVLGGTLLLGLVDGFGMLAGLRDARGLGKLLKQRYAELSVAQICAFGAWPRRHGHGRQLLDACAEEIRRAPRWDVIVAAAVDDEMARLYVSYGLVSITPESGEPSRRVYTAKTR